MPNEFKVKNGLIVDQGGAFITGSSTISGSVSIIASGSNAFTVDGTSGRLFSIDDSLSGSLFSVNTAAGLPIIEAFSDNTIRIGQYGRQALFVSQSRVGIGKEVGLNAILDISGSTIITGSFTASLQNGFAWVGDGNGYSRAVATSSFAGTAVAGTVSGSSQIDITATTGYTAFSQSVAGTDASQSLQINSINSKTGSYATTGSNVFIGNQTVTGSLFTSGSNVLIGNTTLTGSLNISGSTTQIGNNRLLGSTTLSGSVVISGSAPGTTTNINIFGDVSLNGAIKFLPVVENIDTSISASYIYVSGSTQDLYFSQNGSGYNNVTRLRWLEGNLYTGLLHGGLITATNGTTTYQVSSGSGIIVTLNASLTNDPYPTIQYINWGNLTANISPLTASYQQAFVSIDSTGNIYQQGTPYAAGQFDTEINIGLVLFQNGSTINGVKTQPSVAYGFEQQQNIFNRAFGPLKLSGYTLAPSGSSTRSLIVAGGTSYSPGSNYSIDQNNPSYTTDSGTNISKIYRYRQSGSTWVYDTNAGAGYATIDPTQYSNNGVLTAVPGGGGNRQWSIQRVFYFPNSVAKAIVVYYGNAVYTTQTDATTNIPYEPFVEAPNTAANAIYLGAIVVRNDADFTVNASYNIQPGGLFRQVGGSGGGGSVVTQTLAGLSDVAISGPTNGQPLVYDTTAGKWENKSTLTATLVGNASTATNATTASFVTASNVFGPYGSSSVLSASYALTTAPIDITTTTGYTTFSQSLAGTDTSQSLQINSINLKTGSFATTGSNQFVGNQIISGSLIMSGSAPITASIIGNPFGDVIIEAKSGSLDTGSVEIHGGLKWKRTPSTSPTEIGDLVTFGSTMGLIEGGNLTTSSVGGLVVQVSPIVGYTMDTFAYGSHNIQKFNTLNSSDASRQLTLPQTSSVYVYYNSSATLTYNITAPSTRNNIILGKVTTDASNIIYIDASQINAHHYGNYIDRLFREGFGPIFSTGGITTQGTISGSLNVTAATYFFSQNRITTNAGTNISMDTFYRSSTAGQYVRTAGVNRVNSGSYDSGSGTLINIPTGKYAKHSLYLLGDNSLQSTATEAYMMVYGQSIYDTIGDAQAGSLPTPPSFFNDSISIIASIIVTPDSASIQSIIDERPRLGFVSPSKTGVLTAHGDLTGLTNDDHPQYLLTDGSRTLTGNVNLGGNAISNASSISATSITGSIRSTNGVVSGSSQIDITVTTGYTVFSQSLAGTDTSQSVSILIASQSAVGAFQSASAYSSSAATVDAGQSLRLNALETFTSSIGNVNAFTQSANLRLNALETSSASVISRVGSIESFTASVAGTNTFTASVSNSLTSINLKTGSFATTGSNTFIGNQIVTGSFSVSGSINIDGGFY